MNDEKLKRDIEKEYLSKTKKSKKHFENARQCIPGGTSRLITFYQPHPFFVQKGNGCRMYDLDGNEYLDFLNNYSAGIHGHAHPHVEKAIKSQLQNINSTATAVNQYRLAEILCTRIPSIESIRFCNSGTEATMFAIRAARFVTGKNYIIKIDGGYHGAYDLLDVNAMPDLETKGAPRPLLESGISPSVLNDILISPFNDLEFMEKCFKAYKDKIAAVIIEPMPGRGNLIRPHEGYLQGVRELADRYDALLIFDEIMTFRLHTGGMQTMLDVKPDITALGKVIGGGLSVGAFGGRGDIMDSFDPTKRAREDLLIQSGTFSGHAITMAAGAASMEIYDQQEIDRLNALGAKLSKGIENAMNSTAIDGQCLGFGSLIEPIFSKEPLNNVKDAWLAVMPTQEFLRYFHLDIMNQGLFFSPRGMIALSTPMTETEINRAIDIIGNSIEKVKPLIRAAA